jgi:hypothetical protein
MLTHTFRLEQWRDAFLAIANQGESGAVKVALDQRPDKRECESCDGLPAFRVARFTLARNQLARR